MKRAVLVTAGTMVGIAAALNYVPRPLVTDMAAGALEDSSSVDASADAAAESDQVAAPAAATPTTASKKAAAKEAAAAAAAEGSSTAMGVTDSTPALSSSGAAASKPTPGKSKATPAPTTAKKPPTPSATKPPDPAVSKLYTGAASMTPYGAVQVQIAVKNGRITEVGALKYPSTDPKSKELAAKAIPVLKQETIAKQSANLSNISGASFTCSGWKKSLQAALTQAGL